MIQRSPILLTIWILLLPQLVCAQFFSSQNYGLADGLGEVYLNTVVQGNNGFIYAGSANGVIRYGGEEFIQVPFQDSTLSLNITASAVDSTTVYFGHADGGVSKIQRGALVKVLPAATSSSRVLRMRMDPKGQIIALRQNGELLKLGGKATQQFSLPLDGALPSDFAIAKNGMWYISTDLGMMYYDPERQTGEWYASLDGYALNAIAQSSNERYLWIGLEDEGIAVFDLAKSTISELWRPKSPLGWKVNDLSISDNRLWVSTMKHGVYSGTISFRNEALELQLVEQTDLELPRSVNQLFTDREENVWLASAGEGLYMLSFEPFKSFRGNRFLRSDLRDLQVFDDFTLIANAESIQKYYEASDSLVKIADSPQRAAIRCIKHYTDEEVLVGTDRGGLYTLNLSSGKWRSLPLTRDQQVHNVNAIAVSGDYIFAGTNYGIYQLKNEKVISHLSVMSGLPHNTVLSLYADPKGRIWIGTKKSGLAFISEGSLRTVRLPVSSFVDVTDFSMESEDVLWIATAGEGLLRYDIVADKVSRDVSGLMSLYCYSLTKAANTFFVGHRGGLSYVPVWDTEASYFRDAEIAFEGIDIREMRKGADEVSLLMATSNGLFRFHPDLEQEEPIMPLTSLSRVMVSDSSYAFDAPIELPYGRYAIEFEFNGVSFSANEEVKFEHYLEGHDLSWSEPSVDEHVRYSKLSPGDYTFHVRAINLRLNGKPITRSVKFSIAVPFWREWWFIPTLLLFFLGLVRIYFYRRELQMRKNQEYLKSELDLRTKEVVKQKTLVELQNKDITDSIRYAENIQNAILPKRNALKRYFSDGFIIYKPRDIVSGDFYWVDQFGDKVIVACADCTGHGVPGALMSMIGSALLKDISRNNEVNEPAHLLELLDVEIKAMLSRKEGKASIHDGMDIGVLEFDTSKRTLKYAGARRPLILFQNGSLDEVKGDRLSIGGDMTEEHKCFQQECRVLNTGDTFYLFSDGVTDQFGGANGKKFKKSRLIEMLRSVQDRPMQEQRLEIEAKLKKWQSDEPQIDDILLMGIRV